MILQKTVKALYLAAVFIHFWVTVRHRRDRTRWPYGTIYGADFVVTVRAWP